MCPACPDLRPSLLGPSSGRAGLSTDGSARRTSTASRTPTRAPGSPRHAGDHRNVFYQDGLTGSAWGDWSLYADSVLRAFESELGVQPPVGFWDPIGFTKDDADAFNRRCGIEIKHGRISMRATMG